METRVDYEALRAILDPLPIGLILAGEGGEVLLHNARGPELLGLDPFDLLQKGISAFPERIGVEAAWRSLRADPRRREQLLASHRGRELSLTLCMGGFSLYGETCHLILIADITEQKQLEEFHDGFQKEILHRLRGPLTSINTSLAFLRSDACGALPSAVKEVVDLGHAEAQRLHRLVDDVGHLLLLDGPAPAGDLYRENVDLGACARKAVHKAGRQAPAGPGFAMAGGGTAALVLADYDKTGVILARMLSHAAARAAGTAPVRVTAAAVDEDVGEVRIAYAGTGEPEAELQKAFAKFYRPPGKAEADDGGSGLGLYVARGFAELMGGSLDLLAPPGGEVTLVLRLPAARDWGGFGGGGSP